MTLSDRVFVCSECGHDEFKKTWDRLLYCVGCKTMYWPHTMELFVLGPSSYTIPGPPPLNTLPVNIDGAKIVPATDDDW